MLVGPRHFDSTMLAQYKRFFVAGSAPGESDGECGFLDQDGVFLTREKAYVIAFSAGQIRTVDSDVKKLFSENLY